VTTSGLFKRVLWTALKEIAIVILLSLLLALAWCAALSLPALAM
jgi:hypothetical protein